MLEAWSASKAAAQKTQVFSVNVTSIHVRLMSCTVLEREYSHLQGVHVHKIVKAAAQQDAG